MKKLKYITGLLCLLAGVACTKDFDEINTDNQGFNSDEVSAKYFLTSSQVGLYAPGRFEYWRAHLIHVDRFAGHFTFGMDQSWWSDGLSYTYDPGYTDAAYDWLAGYFGNIKSFYDLTKEGGEFENEYMFAISLIMKGLYFQMYTDTFGMVPYSEAGVDGVLTPKYDTQMDIYQGIIGDLDNAMSIIGDVERTGIGVDDVAENDVYCGGDLQLWKKLANTLKLRIGMRALGAPGENFAASTITEAMSQPLLDESTGSVTMRKDFVISEWTSSSYGDVWNDFGAGSDWTVSQPLIDMLQENNDPRLAIYAKPAKGGTFSFVNTKENGTYTDPDYAKRVDFIESALIDAGATYTRTSDADTIFIEVGGGQYIGQPVRLNAEIMPYVRYDLFSTPSDAIIQPRGKEATGYPEIIISSAESYFLQAEAAVRGIGSGDPQTLLTLGIKEAMKLWDIAEGDADAYIASSALADISAGTTDEKLEKIALQRWLASYTDGFEAWAVVRKTGYPSELAAGVSDQVIYALGTLNGAYPQRMRYGTGAQSNPNLSQAISVQGPDVQGTKLWWAK
ncbi:SusD/RagB family nutrient-binding outer membrane lipoprotein [Galbibacter pacificus]|uniref:SusD/RagB family nutrient-binding outer membrane lipoprotein n=1 Tax=Galbibacter pacificus TaxID=2996052 RepID=A0ABT6FT78_9FLAO|nr:SusD/RagB family nutrient-binding outer membrane lipoprotein [Galbibacter pacificus]MDG3582422.1 SusD/RagB family nutrient-binding outer membrane lipoprotein [Galbibacter pacificus]MDG3586460.1 SusD/RagB family nutrient-binding outer membrane lipoprotein [Galbibacter pacificus]